jgi:hypothetical protein
MHTNIDIGGLKIFCNYLEYPIDQEFDPFLIDKSLSKPDITWRIIKINSNMYSGMLPNKRLQQCLKEATVVGIPFMRSKILYSIQFQNYLFFSKSYCKMLTIEINENSISIFDFKKNVAIFFLSENFKNNNIIGSLMLSVFAPSFSSILLHTSAIVRNNKAILFLAPDEGGKTTAAKLSKNFILCDDQILVRQTSEGFIACGTPWGLYTANMRVPLGAICILEKSCTCSLQEISIGECYKYIFNEHKNQIELMPHFQQEKMRYMIAHMCISTPLFKLSFTKDEIQLNEIDKIIQQRRY